jgi:AcrR family transcriptional regulator
LGISERKQRQKDHVRQHILDAAWQIVLEQGWQALSVRGIAEAIEYSTPVIYSHFESKEVMLQEFYKQGFSQLAQKLTEAKNKHQHPEDGLYAIAMAYWDFAFNNKEYYQVMFGVNLPCCYQRQGVPEVKIVIMELLNDTIKKILKLNKNEKADYALKRSTIWCILHGLVSINLTGRLLKEEGKTERVLDDAVRGFIKSLKP